MVDQMSCYVVLMEEDGLPMDGDPIYALYGVEVPDYICKKRLLPIVMRSMFSQQEINDEKKEIKVARNASPQSDYILAMEIEILNLREQVKNLKMGSARLIKTIREMEELLDTEVVDGVPRAYCKLCKREIYKSTTKGEYNE